jgi:hypothetical protein
VFYAQMLTLPLLLGLAVAPDTLPPAPRIDSAVVAPVLAAPEATADTVHKRRKAVEYSDAYAVRLEIHRIGSYTMLPLFAAEWALGQNLMNGNSPSWVKPTHLGVALGIGALFTVNTVTGAMNLYESRNDPAGRTRRIVHSALMIASDAGFAIAGALGGDADTPDKRRRHRNVALASIGVSTAGTALMWFWKD